jgi:radical SAM superfamily enzyme YgiQ (UPF0313 family)
LDDCYPGGRPGTFFLFVTDRLKSLTFDVIGFSSICSSYPLTLRLINEVKRLRPETPVILGGPQASVVDIATMGNFSSVDFIVRGEADETLPSLLDTLYRRDASAHWEVMTGLTYRRSGEVIRNTNASVIEDLDQIPLPAFDLDSNMSQRTGVHLEIGRGCPFACTFCSTNDFFRRNFRLKSTKKMLEEMGLIKEKYGITYFSLVHDMYTIDRKKVAAFCTALIDSRGEFTWGCSARTDCIDDELIQLMARAGCRGIFFGIETGSDRLQHVINKKLDLRKARERIRCADRNGIDTAVALITGFPEETRDDLRDTIHFFIDSLRYDHAEPQISLLAPLAATPIHEKYKNQLEFDSIFSDMSHQGWRHDPVEVAMIKQYPDVFPNFYAVPTSWLSRAYLKELIDFVTYLASWFRWLPVALLKDSGDFLAVFDRWRQWLTEKRAAGAGEETGVTPYYSHRKFRSEFVEFTRDCYLEDMASARPAIGGLVRAEGVSLATGRRLDPNGTLTDSRIDLTLFPFLAGRVTVLELDTDYKEITDCLREERSLSSVTERQVTIVFLPREGQIQVWQLAPQCAEVLHMCDGKRTVSDISREFCRSYTDSDGIPTEKVCLFALMILREQGVLGFSSLPVVVDEDSHDANRSSSFEYCPSLRGSSGTQQPWPPHSETAPVPKFC